MDNPYSLSFESHDDKPYVDEKGRRCIDLTICGETSKWEIIGEDPKGIGGYKLKEVKDE